MSDQLEYWLAELAAVEAKVAAEARRHADSVAALAERRVAVFDALITTDASMAYFDALRRGHDGQG
jgi:hypothetical protein